LPPQLTLLVGINKLCVNRQGFRFSLHLLIKGKKKNYKWEGTLAVTSKTFGRVFGPLRRMKNF